MVPAANAMLAAAPLHMRIVTVPLLLTHKFNSRPAGRVVFAELEEIAHTTGSPSAASVTAAVESTAQLFLVIFSAPRGLMAIVNAVVVGEDTSALVVDEVRTRTEPLSFQTSPAAGVVGAVPEGTFKEAPPVVAAVKVVLPGSVTPADGNDSVTAPVAAEAEI